MLIVLSTQMRILVIYLSKFFVDSIVQGGSPIGLTALILIFLLLNLLGRHIAFVKII